MRDDRERLLDILEAIEKIENNFDKKRFIRDEILQAAIIRYLEIIGEASKNVTNETKNKLKEIEWTKIVAFRNFIVHNYFDVDWDIITKVIEEDIPKLKLQIKSLLAKKL